MTMTGLIRETTREGASKERDADRQALAACLKIFIDGTCLFWLSCFCFVRPAWCPGAGYQPREHQVGTAIVGNLERLYWKIISTSTSFRIYFYFGFDRLVTSFQRQPQAPLWARIHWRLAGETDAFMSAEQFFANEFAPTECRLSHPFVFIRKPPISPVLIPQSEPMTWQPHITDYPVGANSLAIGQYSRYISIA